MAFKSGAHFANSRCMDAHAPALDLGLAMQLCSCVCVGGGGDTAGAGAAQTGSMAGGSSSSSTGVMVATTCVPGNCAEHKMRVGGRKQNEEFYGVCFEGGHAHTAPTCGGGAGAAGSNVARCAAALWGRGG